MLPHITDDFAEAKSIQHILTHLENKQAKSGFICQINPRFSKETRRYSINEIKSLSHDALKKYFDNPVLVTENHRIAERQNLHVF